MERDIRVKDNEFKLGEKLSTVLKAWENFCYEHMDVDYIKEFYYYDELVMTTVVLKNESYGQFNVTSKRISYNGCSCKTKADDEAFGKATWNDSLYDGELKI